MANRPQADLCRARAIVFDSRFSSITTSYSKRFETPFNGHFIALYYLLQTRQDMKLSSERMRLEILGTIGQLGESRV
jgi:hypothetical protein